jgi:hypothetical protein
MTSANERDELSGPAPAGGGWLSSGVNRGAGIPLIVLAGVALCLTSLLMMLMRDLEGDYVLPVLNLAFAWPVAAVVSGPLTLLGDSLLLSIRRRVHRPPARRLLTGCVVLAAGAVAAALILAQPGSQCSLSRWIGLLGGAALVSASLSSPSQIGELVR